MSKSLVIINPHACAGQAANIWQSIEADFTRLFGEPLVAITQTPGEIPAHLEAASAEGIEQVFSVGGDGTNHTLVNALVKHNMAHSGQIMCYGAIPAGTGQDWARGLGMPLKAAEALNWLHQAQPRAADVGYITYDGQERYFLNIASAGISHDVIPRVERMKHSAAAFLRGSVEAILSYQPEYVRVRADGKSWFDGKMFLIAICNGKYFGQGMKAAPEAQPDDNLLDVLIVPAMSRLRLLSILPTVYSGSHLKNPAIRFQRANRIDISTGSVPLGIDLDGEPTAGRHLSFTVKQGLLKILTH